MRDHVTVGLFDHLMLEFRPLASCHQTLGYPSEIPLNVDGKKQMINCAHLPGKSIALSLSTERESYGKLITIARIARPLKRDQ
jgi:hypothetical protein